jgi:LysR family glycine cleavage system transcriptional activator
MRNERYGVPPLDPLLAFEAAARNLSFTKAAAELFLTQSAVSRQIQQLEEHLGTKLFERRARALLLTESGQLFYRTVQDVLQKLHDGSRRLRGAATMNTVVVATTPGFASLWLIPHLAGFTRDHSQVDVRISATHEIIDDLERAQVDVAVRYVPEGTATGGRLLFGETVFPVCSPELTRNTANPLVRPDDLQRHVLLYLERPRAAWLDWELWFHALGLRDFEPAGKLHFSHYDQLIQAALDGHGVALGRHPLLRQLLRERKLVAPFKNKVASSRAYYVVVSPAAKAKKQVREFADWLVEATHVETLEPPAAETA